MQPGKSWAAISATVCVMSSKKHYSQLGDQSYSYSSLAKCKAPHSIPSTATPTFNPGTMQERQNSLCSLRKGSSIKPSLLPPNPRAQSCWLERSEKGEDSSLTRTINEARVGEVEPQSTARSVWSTTTNSLAGAEYTMRKSFICRERPIKPPFPNPKALPVHSEKIQVWGGILIHPESNEHLLNFPGFLS